MRLTNMQFVFQNGDTALHIAAAMGRRKLTKILLESGCDKDSKNKQSETSLDISRREVSSLDTSTAFWTY